MARPSGWDILGLDADPTPGVVESVTALAKQFHDFADDAERAWRDLNSFGGDAAALQWIGQTADAFKSNFGPLPGRMQKLYTSYREAGDALAAYAPKLQAAQAKADTVLRQAQDTHADVQRATTAANNAATDLKTAQQNQAANPSQQAVTDAQTAHDTAQKNLDAAKAQLDALAKTAHEAHDDRITAAKECARALHQAQSDGIHNQHWWEHVGEILSEWGGKIAEVANDLAPFLDVLALATSWIPGVDVVTAALAEADNLIALAGTAMKIAGDGMQGHWGDALMGAGMLALTFAGGKALGKVAGKFGKEAEGDAQALAGAERSKGAQSFEGNRGATTEGDPVDVVSGQMLTWDDDVTLPCVLPLVLRRAYASGYQTGRLFGPGWASTLDQRLSVNAAGIHFVGDDAETLHYALPEDSRPIYPAEGARWPLVWDRATDEIRISDPLRGYTWHFPAVHHSEEAGQIRDLAALSDRSGNRIEFVRDAVGTPLAVQHSGGYRVAVDLRETAAGPRVSALRLVSGAESMLLIGFGYDERGRLHQVVDPEGNALEYSWDEADRIIGWRDRLGLDYHYTYDARGRVVHGEGNHGFLTTSFEYRDEERATLVTDPDGHMTRFGYDELGRIVAVTDPAGNTELRQLDRHGHPLSVIDEAGRSTTFERDELGQVLRSTTPDAAVTVTTWAGPGMPEQITDPTGAVWRYSYDALGRLTAETDPVGAVTSYEYTASGHLSRITDPAGGVVAVECDPAGLPLRIRDADGSVTTITRDAAGRISTLTDGSGRTTRQQYDTRGNLRRRILPDGATWTYSYDDEGNLSAEHAPDGSVSTWQYTFLNTLIGRTDADGAGYRFAYDGRLRLASVTGPTGAEWRYEYDRAGHLTAETDFNGRRLDYERDPVGQVTAVSQADGRRRTFSRDARGRITAVDADGEVTRYAFDPAGRLVRAVAPGTELAREYDAAGRLIAETVDGNAVTYRYDAAGRIVGTRLSQGPEASWEFSAGGAVARLSAAGHEIEFTTDADGRATSWTADRRLHLARGFDAAGRLAAQRVSLDHIGATVGAGVEGGIGIGAVSEPDAGARALPRASALLAREYVYSPSELLAEIHGAQAGTRRFGLTRGGRVTEVQAESWRETYAYDALGNLASAGSSDGEPAVHVHDGTLISSAGRTVYRHDAAGRVVSKSRRLLSGGTKTWTYRWDAHNRLTAATTPDNTVWRYHYDPLGRRIGKTRLNDDGTVAEHFRFTWEGNRLAAVTAPDGTVTAWNYLPGTFAPITQHTHTPGHQVDPDLPVTYDVSSVTTPLSSTDFALVVTDPVGTPTELISADGRVTWQQHATIWGLPTAGDSLGPGDCPLGFPGQYHDAETGLRYNLHRYYDPEAAAYLTPDPLGLEPAPNQYAYVANPLTDTDPLGLYPASGNRGGNGTNQNPMPRSQADDVAKYLGYTKTKEISAGKSPIWVNKKAGSGQPKYITWDRTGHNGGIFKGASFDKPFRSTKDTARDGTFDLDVDGSGNVNGLKWVGK